MQASTAGTNLRSIRLVCLSPTHKCQRTLKMYYCTYILDCHTNVLYQDITFIYLPSSQHQYSSEDQYKTIFLGNSTHCMSAEVIRRLQATSWVPAPAQPLRGRGSNQSARIQTCKLSQLSCSPLFILEMR